MINNAQSQKYKLPQLRGVARMLDWGDERRRHEKRGAEGAEGVGCGEGAVPPPQKFF